MLYITADGTLTNFAVESLKQLNTSVSTPVTRGETGVKVAAHFSFPGGATNPGGAGAGAPANQTTHEYIFPAPGNAPVNRSLVLTLPAQAPVSKQANTPAKANMPAQANAPAQANKSEKETLKAFLNGVYGNSGLKSQHYALILRGHGPELLLRPPASNSTSDIDSLYLTPKDLREALTECTPPEGSNVEIIGFDACFMSMLEMADELKGLAKYMVASQNEVPDLSFPYANLVALLQKHGKNTTSLLTEGVQAYVATYQDCICNNTTEMNPVTLSVLELDKCDALTGKVKSLACALLRAKDDPELQCPLIQARKESQDYAGGLYVDLYEFCTKLNVQLDTLKAKKLDKKKELDGFKELDELKKEELDALNKTIPWIESILSECKGVRKALDISKEGDSLVVLNASVDRDGKDPRILFDSPDLRKKGISPKTTNHGVSIYLPYLTDQQYTQVQRPLAKGTPDSHSGKGFSDVLNGAGIEYLMCARRDLILDTESYYPDLQLASDTSWYDFITQVWTRALIKKVPADLDYHYSAQQSWINVCRKMIF
jgi:hypothetical protein